MGLPNKCLPLLYYTTKEEYENKLAEMTSSEIEEYNNFYVGFIEDTREFHTHGAMYKCGREWGESDVYNNATNFVINSSVQDSVLLEDSTIAVILNKSIKSSTNVQITLSTLEGNRIYTCTSSDNGNTWNISNTTNNIILKASDVQSVSASPNTIMGRDDNGDTAIRCLIDDSSLTLAFPRSTDAAKQYADYILQEEISDLDTIRAGAAAGATALQTVPSKYTTTYTITALQGTMPITTYNNLISNKFVTFAPTSIPGLSITTGNRVGTSAGALYSAVYRDTDAFKLLTCTFTISGTIVRYVINLYALDISATQITSI